MQSDYNADDPVRLTAAADAVLTILLRSRNHDDAFDRNVRVSTVAGALTQTGLGPFSVDETTEAIDFLIRLGMIEKLPAEHED